MEDSQKAEESGEVRRSEGQAVGMGATGYTPDFGERRDGGAGPDGAYVPGEGGRPTDSAP